LNHNGGSTGRRGQNGSQGLSGIEGSYKGIVKDNFQGFDLLTSKQYVKYYQNGKLISERKF
jgi:hypothetical protein